MDKRFGAVGLVDQVQSAPMPQRSVQLVDIYEVHSQVDHADYANEIRSRRETAVLHAKYVASNQEHVQIWDVFLYGILRRRFTDAPALTEYLRSRWLTINPSDALNLDDKDVRV